MRCIELHEKRIFSLDEKTAISAEAIPEILVIAVERLNI